jgi:hypothetical protein
MQQCRIFFVKLVLSAMLMPKYLWDCSCVDVETIDVFPGHFVTTEAHRLIVF